MYSFKYVYIRTYIIICVQVIVSRRAIVSWETTATCQSFLTTPNALRTLAPTAAKSNIHTYLIINCSEYRYNFHFFSNSCLANDEDECSATSICCDPVCCQHFHYVLLVLATLNHLRNFYRDPTATQPRIFRNAINPYQHPDYVQIRKVFKRTPFLTVPYPSIY